MFHGEVQPKTGSPCMFSAEKESDIALFMKHCQFLRIPRTKQMLKDDIWHFVKFKQLHVPTMPEDRPDKIFYNSIISPASFFR